MSKYTYVGTYRVPFVIMSLAMIPVPSRFVLALAAVAELNLLILVSTLLKSLKIWKLLDDYKTLLILSAFVAIVTIYSRLIALWSPETQMQLGFVLYLQAMSSFIISTTFGDAVGGDDGDAEGDGGDKWRNMKVTAVFSAVALVMFAIRDILGYGTITYPVLGGVGQTVIMGGGTSALTLLATVPGALLCTAAMIGILVTVENVQDIFARADGGMPVQGKQGARDD